MTENERFTVPSKYCLSHSKIQCDGTLLTNNELVKILNINDGAFLENFNLKIKNKELQERNNRQYKRLGQLYKLIDKHDWESLITIVEEQKQAEEQIWKEWGTYSVME